MDKVFICGLKVDTVIGVYDWERKIRQTLLVDVEMSTDIRPAAAEDDLGKALDYHRISIRLQEMGKENSFQLIETLAEKMAAMLLTEFPITQLTLSLQKPGAVPDAQTVGITIARSA
ncbi:MAG: dihydroneopterin aldolase [Cellvibrionaceae bacterium]